MSSKLSNGLFDAGLPPPMRGEAPIAGDVPIAGWMDCEPNPCPIGCIGCGEPNPWPIGCMGCAPNCPLGCIGCIGCMDCMGCAGGRAGDAMAAKGSLDETGKGLPMPPAAGAGAAIAANGSALLSG